MHDLSLKTDILIQDLKRLEQVWFRIVLPALEQVTQEAQAISDEEFAATYSEERAEKDPYYDARRILEGDWNFYATHNQLLYARQSTIHALFIALGQIIEQYLIDLLRYLDETQTSRIFLKFEGVIKAFHTVGVNIECTKHWNSIAEVRNVANYLKHGVGISSKNAQNILIQHIGPGYDPEFDTALFYTPQLKDQAALPDLPLRDTGIALSEETLAAYFSEIYAFFSDLGKNSA